MNVSAIARAMRWALSHASEPAGFKLAGSLASSAIRSICSSVYSTDPSVTQPDRDPTRLSGPDEVTSPAGSGSPPLASYTTVECVGSVLDTQMFSLGCELVEYPLAFQFLTTPVGEDVGEPDASTVAHTTEWDGPLFEESDEEGT